MTGRDLGTSDGAILRQGYMYMIFFLARYIVTGCIFCAPSAFATGSGFRPPATPPPPRPHGKSSAPPPPPPPPGSYPHYSALLWQKEASDKSGISCKRARCVCHLHWRQWNITMSYVTYLLAGWVFMHKIWPKKKSTLQVKYENINNSDLDGMSLASFCQSRAVLIYQARTKLFGRVEGEKAPPPPPKQKVIAS